jgi:hypothetical protein
MVNHQNDPGNIKFSDFSGPNSGSKVYERGTGEEMGQAGFGNMSKSNLYNTASKKNGTAVNSPSKSIDIWEYQDLQLSKSTFNIAASNIDQSALHPQNIFENTTKFSAPRIASYIKGLNIKKKEGPGSNKDLESLNDHILARKEFYAGNSAQKRLGLNSDTELCLNYDQNTAYLNSNSKNQNLGPKKFGHNREMEVDSSKKGSTSNKKKRGGLQSNTTDNSQDNSHRANLSNYKHMDEFKASLKVDFKKKRQLYRHQNKFNNNTDEATSLVSDQ